MIPELCSLVENWWTILELSALMRRTDPSDQAMARSCPVEYSVSLILAFGDELGLGVGREQTVGFPFYALNL